MSDILMLATGGDERIVQELKEREYITRIKHSLCYDRLSSSFIEKCMGDPKVSFEK
jgi:hypothetical protein